MLRRRGGVRTLPRTRLCQDYVHALVDPLDPNSSIAQTETRVQVTDAVSRARFRRYWSFLSPGMELIRIVLLQQLEAEAEARYERLAV